MRQNQAGLTSRVAHSLGRLQRFLVREEIPDDLVVTPTFRHGPETERVRAPNTKSFLAAQRHFLGQRVRTEPATRRPSIHPKSTSPG